MATAEKDLVKLLKKRDKEAFQEVFDRYGEKAYHLALRISRNPEDAEEIVQEAFLNVFRKINKFEEKSAFSSWLYRITVNTALMKLRTRRKHDAVSLEDSWLNVMELPFNRRSDQTDIEFISTRHELREKLQAAINDLPNDYRQIFILRDIDGLSNQDVSDIVGTSVPAVKSRLHRARNMLRKKLLSYYKDYTSQKEIFVGEKLAA